MIDTSSSDGLSRDEQWDSITRFLRAAGVEKRSFADFAETVEIEWPANRLNEHLGAFLDTDWEFTQKKPGLGSRKLTMLFRNLSGIATHLGWRFQSDPVPPISAPSPSQDPAIIIGELGLPHDFPVSAAFFSERVLEFCAEESLLSVVDLARFTNSPGWRKVALAHRNFGKTSLTEIEEFSDALRRIDKGKLQDYLPIRCNGVGIDIGLITLLVARMHPTIGLDGFLKRLVHGATLEEIANEKRLTRERVRQIETILLEAVQRALSAGASFRTELWAEWSDTGEIISMGTEHGNDADRLATAAVERLFAESDDGKVILATREAGCLATFESLREEPTFYSGNLVLTEYLAARNEAVSLRHLLNWNKRTSAFIYHLDSGRAEAVNPRPRQITAALLKRGVTNASEILEFLTTLKDPVAWDVTDLRRNYQYWRQNTEFPAIDLFFPIKSEPVSGGLKSRPTSRQSAENQGEPATYSIIRNALRRRRERPTCSQDTLVFHDQLQMSLPGADTSQLKGLEQTLRGILAVAADTQPLLGLLPVAPDLQAKSIGCVKSAVANSFNRLLVCLRELPCLTGYVLAIGPGSTMDGLAFFEPLEQYLDISIPNPKRTDLAETFRQTGQQLGLLPIPPKDRTDNVWPFVFQAAIIPRFVEPLIEAMLRELKECIPPDLDNSDGLAHFARGVASHINPSQQRLRKILQSDAGASVSRVLLRGYQTDDFTQMPPHLEKRCAEAFRDIQPQQRYSLISPYVVFDSHAGELSLVLPRQSPRLLLPDTIWSLDAAHRFPADTETRLSVCELEQATLTPVLAPLHHRSIRKWEPQVELRLSIETPVWLFDAASGRRAQYKADHVDGVDVLRLPSGRDFAILVLQEVSSDLPDEQWKPLANNLKTVTYEAFWGQTAITLTFRDRHWRITCREEPCILLAPETGGRLRTTNGDEIFYGTGLKATLIAPPEGETNEDIPSVRVAAQEALSVGSEAELEVLIERHVTGLSCGLHFLDFEFRAAVKTTRRKTWFWKGLTHVDSSFGFRCATPPINIRWADCEGIVKDDSGVRVLPKWLSPEIVVSTENPGARLRLRRPGISVAILDASTGFEEPYELGTVLHVPPNDPRRLLVRLEATGKWSIETGSTVVARTEDGSLKAAFRLGDLVGDQSGSARMTATNGDNAPIVLLRLHRQVAVTGMEVAPDGIEKRYYIRFCVPHSITTLAVSRFTFPRTNDTAKNITVIPLLVGKVEGLGDLAGAAATVKEAFGGGLLVELFVPYVCLNDDWHVFELLHRETAIDEWHILHVADGIGVNGSRWILSPTASTENTSTDFTRSLLRLARNRSDLDAQKLDEPAIPDDPRAIHDAFESIEFLLDYRYSHAAWEAAKWAPAAFIWLVKHIQETKPAVMAQRAVRGLAQRPNNSDSFRPIHFGASELACAFPSRHFKLPAYPVGAIGDCFSVIGQRVDSQSTVKLLAAAGSDISWWPFTHFGNFASAATGKAERFQNLKLADLLVDLAKRIDQFSLHTDDPDSGALLSSRHWAEAYAAFEKRFRRLRVDEAGGAGPRNSIARIEPYLRNIEIPLKQAFHLSPGIDLEWTSLPGDGLSRTVLRLVFWTAALGRMSAFGWIGPNDFRAILRRVFNDESGDPTVIRRGLSLCIGLSPEWFSASMLLWELIISDLPNPNHKNTR